MRDKFNPLTKFCGTLTVPSPGTESIGLPADDKQILILNWSLLELQNVKILT